MSDVNHVVSKALVNNAGEKRADRREDLTGIRKRYGTCEAEEQIRVRQLRFYDLRQKIEYKAALNGSIVHCGLTRDTPRRCARSVGHTEKG